MNKKRTAFFISNRTGLTTEVLGRGLLTQFDRIASAHFGVRRLAAALGLPRYVAA